MKAASENGSPGCPLGLRPGLGGDRGAALIIALLVMGSLLLLGTAFLTISSTETQIAVNQRDAAQALFAAESGLARARRDALYDYWQDQDFTQSRDTGGNLVQGLLAPGVLNPYLIAEMTPDDPFYAYRNDYYRLGYPVTAAFTTVGTGGFRVYVRKPLLQNAITFRVVGFAGSGAQRDLEATYLVRNYSLANNALFVNGAVTVDSSTAFQVAGSVHIRGTGLANPATDLAIKLPAQSTVVNHYGDMDAGLKAKVPSIRNSPEDLRAEFRVKAGVTQIIGDPSSVGEPAGARDPLDVKTNVKGGYTTNSFTGARPNNVYSDNGKTVTYDATGDLDSRLAFPDITSTYTSPRNGLPETNPNTNRDHTYETHILANSYQVNGPLIIRNDATVVGNTLYKSDGTKYNLSGGMDFNAYNYGWHYDGGAWVRVTAGTIMGLYTTDPAGTWTGSISLGSGSNTLSWDLASRTLTISGVIAVRGNDNTGDIVLGGGGTGPLTISYNGRGTLYSQYDSEIHADLVPASGTFPADHSLGLIAGDTMRIGWPREGSLDSGLSVPTTDQANLRIAAAIFGQNRVAVGNNTQVAGAIVAKSVRLKGNPKIFQVPALANPRPNLPQEVPGSAPIYVLQAVTWREITP